ncbi:hypothetical protein [Winogradskyella forsetii]|nr:hypothetical protein [Winogradskyella forsetii]
MKEDISIDGSKLKSYSILLVGDDWTKATKLFLNKKNLFTWNLNEVAIYDGQILFNSVYWNVSRKRSFYKKMKIEFNGRIYETLVFKDIYDYNIVENQNYNKSKELDFFDFIQYSYFSQGIGIIRYEREFENGKIDTMHLVEILLKKR